MTEIIDYTQPAARKDIHFCLWFDDYSVIIDKKTFSDLSLQGKSIKKWDTVRFLSRKQSCMCELKTLHFLPGPFEGRATIEGATVTLQRVTQEDAGEYRCEISAPLDSVNLGETNVTLKVLGKTQRE